MRLYSFVCAGLIGGSVFAAVPTPEHVVVVIEENHSASSILGNASVPWINDLANTGANFTNFYAITHPSQPNYLELFSGSTQGVTGDGLPGVMPFPASNLGASLRDAGKTFGGYSEDLPAVGSNVETSGNYARKHNPWVNWQVSGTPSGTQLAAAVNMPFTSFPTTAAGFANLPQVSFVVPNLQNDMHDGTPAQGDTWLANNLTAYKNWAATHNSMLVVTFDEDEHAERNKIPTILWGPMMKTGANTQTWTLHNLLRTIEDMYGAEHSGAAAKATPINGVWTNEVETPTTVKFRRGTGGYNGVSDTYMDQANPATSQGSANPVVVDGSPMNHGMIKFDNLTQSKGGSIPDGAIITAAMLSITTGNVTNDSSATNTELHRMLVDWNESATWNSMSSAGTLANGEVDQTVRPSVLDGVVNFDVRGAVQEWVNGGVNYGWELLPLGTDGWRWNSSESGTEDLRPVLTVSFVVPEPSVVALVGGGGLLFGRQRDRRQRSKVNC